MRVKQKATMSFMPANKPEMRKQEPSAHYQLLSKNPAAEFRKLRDEDDWYSSRDPHRPKHYSPEWRTEMQRASAAAREPDEVEQAHAQAAVKTNGQASNQPTKQRPQEALRQSQRNKDSSATELGKKRKMDDSEEDDANLRRSKRVRSSATPPDAMSVRGTIGADEPADDDAVGLRLSTMAPMINSTTPPKMQFSPERHSGPQRLKINVKVPTNSGPGNKTADSQSNSDGDQSVPAALTKPKKKFGAATQAYTPAQLSWMNKWFNDDNAGRKIYSGERHLQIKRDFEKEYVLTKPLAANSLRNKRQEMKLCGQLDGTVRSKEFYEKAENYPRKVPTVGKKGVKKATVTRGGVDEVNASAVSQGGQTRNVQVESSKKRKHDDLTTEDGSGEIGDSEELEGTSPQSPKRRRSGSGNVVLEVGAGEAASGLNVEDSSPAGEQSFAADV
ncbi:hypothetical protein FKW77_004076 [Venturia effusa]|uniref:Uncharacterized protein n=1 Tax=Venturia effusa TaxID=50376 RepID=A0A517LGZ1_9PEZI|nr:hypothetical protein FKW77_004076 [Venturia effusa]